MRPASARPAIQGTRRRGAQAAAAFALLSLGAGIAWMAASGSPEPQSATTPRATALVATATAAAIRPPDPAPVANVSLRAIETRARPPAGCDDADATPDRREYAPPTSPTVIAAAALCDFRYRVRASDSGAILAWVVATRNDGARFRTRVFETARPVEFSAPFDLDARPPRRLQRRLHQTFLIFAAPAASEALRRTAETAFGRAAAATGEGDIEALLNDAKRDAVAVLRAKQDFDP